MKGDKLDRIIARLKVIAAELKMKEQELGKYRHEILKLLESGARSNPRLGKTKKAR
jgi:hypothetical protein